MSSANGSTKLVQVGVAAVVILATTITLLGLNGKVQTLDGQVQKLEESVSILDEVEARIDKLQRTSVELGHFRNDILAAVCAANARTRDDLRRCQRVSG